MVAALTVPASPPAPLYLPTTEFQSLWRWHGPSLGLWRAAEIAALRQVAYEPPILDLGCGDGLVTSCVLSQVDIGVDPWPGALAQARTRGIYRRLLAVSAEEISLPGGSIGTVLSNSVLEHLPRLDAALQAIGRILRPGGLLVFTTPTDAFGRQLLVTLNRYSAWRNRRLRHLNLLSSADWSRRLSRVGLEVAEVRPYLRPALVRLWDGLELAQEVWIGRRRLFSLLWRSLPPSALDLLAKWAATLDLSASPPSGGQLIVVRKV